MENKGFGGVGELPPPHFPYAPFPLMHPHKQMSADKDRITEKRIPPTCPMPTSPVPLPPPNVAPWATSVPFMGCWITTLSAAEVDPEGALTPFISGNHIIYEVPEHFVGWVKYLEVSVADALCDTVRCEIWSQAAREAIEVYPDGDDIANYGEYYAHRLTCLPTGFYNLNMQVFGEAAIYVRLTNLFPADRSVTVRVWGWKAEETCWDDHLVAARGGGR